MLPAPWRDRAASRPVVSVITARARSVAEAIIAEERVKRHNVLADRLTDAMRVNGADSGAAFIAPGQRPHRQFLVELTPRKTLADLVLPCHSSMSQLVTAPAATPVSQLDVTACHSSGRDLTRPSASR